MNAEINYYLLAGLIYIMGFITRVYLEMNAIIECRKKKICKTKSSAFKDWLKLMFYIIYEPYKMFKKTLTDKSLEIEEIIYLIFFFLMLILYGISLNIVVQYIIEYSLSNGLMFLYTMIFYNMISLAFYAAEKMGNKNKLK